MKWCELEVGKGLNRPTISAISVHVEVRCLPALPKVGHQGHDLRIIALHHQRADSGIQRSAGSDSDGSVLPADQLLRLRGPGHQLAIYAHPSGLKFFPIPRRCTRTLDAREKLALQISVGEESAAGSGQASSDSFIADPKTPGGRLFITTNDHDRSRSHVLFFADDFLHAFMREVVECLCGMLEQPCFLAALGR